MLVKTKYFINYFSEHILIFLYFNSFQPFWWSQRQEIIQKNCLCCKLPRLHRVGFLQKRFCWFQSWYKKTVQRLHRILFCHSGKKRKLRFVEISILFITDPIQNLLCRRSKRGNPFAESGNGQTRPDYDPRRLWDWKEVSEDIATGHSADGWPFLLGCGLVIHLFMGGFFSHRSNSTAVDKVRSSWIF